MLTLRTLGALYACRENGPPLDGAAAQRRVLALLAVLAVAGEAGLSRDKIIALLWPDGDPERARHALTQALYASRRALGVDDLFLAGSDVRLNPARITTDIDLFERALTDGDLARAAATYQGPFLDGFYLSGTTEFEPWVFAQRTRLEARAMDAIARLADAAHEAGDLRAAVEWRRRIASAQPLDAGAAVNFMNALASAGDRAGAVQHARVHATLLRDQLDLGPDPVVEALAERLREPVDWTPTPNDEDTADEIDEHVAVASAAPWESAPSHAMHEPATLALAMTNGSVAPSPVEVLVPQRRVRAWAWLATTLALVLAVLVGALVERRLMPRPTLATLDVPQQVVVAPFRVAGANASLGYLRDGMVELLSTRLADDSASRSVDAGAVLGAWRSAGLRGAVDIGRDTIVKLARRLGAERVVIGSVVGTPARAVIGASVVSVATGAVTGTATVEGPVDSLTTLVDRLAARLLTADADEDDRLAAQTTSSLAALRAFLDGQAAYRRTSYAAAVRRYERALDADSTFALAALRLALAAGQLNDATEEATGVAAAWRHRDALSERDQAQLVALAGPRYPAPSTAAEQLAAWEHVVDVAPARAESWFQLATRLYHDGAAAGLRSADARAAGALQHALSIDPSFAPARQLLARLAATSTDTTLGTRVAIDGAEGIVARWRGAVAASDAATLRHVRDSIPLLGPATLRAIALASQHEGIAIADGRRALDALAARATRASDRVDAELGVHAFALAVHDTVAAVAATTRLAELEPSVRRASTLRVLDALYGGGSVRAGTAAAAELARSATTPDESCALAQWRLARGETTGVAGTIAQLRTRAPACASIVDGMHAVATRRADAPAIVTSLDSLVFTGPSAWDVATYAPLAIARMHERLGDTTGALAALRRRGYMRGWAPYAGAIRAEETRLAARAAGP